MSSVPDLFDIFDKASEIAAPSERAAYLDRVCDGYPALRIQVEAMLMVAANVTDNFLETPISVDASAFPLLPPDPNLIPAAGPSAAQ